MTAQDAITERMQRKQARFEASQPKPKKPKAEPEPEPEPIPEPEPVEDVAAG